jgi:hypothetical protein
MMPLILAIEPDERQAAQLANVIRRRVKAELVVVPTTDHALATFARRVPDLLLVPSFLSQHDDDALARVMRGNPATAHIQMLTIPVLNASVSTMRGNGLLSLLRRDTDTASPDASVFAEQIVEYLQRAARDRAAAAVGDVARSETTPQAAGAINEAFADVLRGPDPGAVQSEPEQAEEADPSDAFFIEPWEPLSLNAPNGLEAPTFSEPPVELAEPQEADLQVDSAPEPTQTPVSAQWAELIASLEQDLQHVGAPTPPPDASTDPVQQVRDEWSYFDPAECGFAALIAKLDEVTREARITAGQQRLSD